MAEVPRTRRSALEAIGLLALGAAGLWRFLTPRQGAGNGPGSETVRLTEEEVPADGALVLPQFGFAVVREGAELVALDLACTHLGCTVTANEGGFACPCHGSRFSSSGQVLSGPAALPLRRLAIEREGGALRVARGQASSGKGPCAGCAPPPPRGVPGPV